MLCRRPRRLRPVSGEALATVSVSVSPRPDQLCQRSLADSLGSDSRTISFTVQPKADSIYKIVGAASIAAKVRGRLSVMPGRSLEFFPNGLLLLQLQITRDRWISHWLHPEAGLPYKLKAVEEPALKKRKAAESKGGKGKKGKAAAEEEEDVPGDTGVEAEPLPEAAAADSVVIDGISSMDDLLEVLMGSGYPSGARSGPAEVTQCTTADTLPSSQIRRRKPTSSRRLIRSLATLPSSASAGARSRSSSRRAARRSAGASSASACNANGGSPP